MIKLENNKFEFKRCPECLKSNTLILCESCQNNQDAILALQKINYVRCSGRHRVAVLVDGKTQLEYDAEHYSFEQNDNIVSYFIGSVSADVVMIINKPF